MTRAVDLTSVAIGLAADGYRVLPLRPGGKVPTLEDWPHQATSDIATVAAWWTSKPSANVGVATGSGLVVIDVDEGGEATLHALESTLGELPKTRRVVTAHGGEHRYFRVPQDVEIPNSVRRVLGPGLDVRGDGGQVVGPGSVVDGNPYVVTVHDTEADLPAAWLAKLVGTAGGPRAMLSAPAAAIGEGMRDDTLFRLGCAMRDKGIGATAIYRALAAENAERCQPPLDDADVRRIASSAAKYVAGELPGRVGRPGVTAPAAIGEIGMTSAADVAPENVDFLWTGRIPLGMVTVVVGPGGDGKSLLMGGKVAAAVTTGHLPGLLLGQPANVAICSAEDHRASVIIPRLMAAGADLSRIWFPGWRQDDGTLDDIAIDGQVAALEAALREHDVRLLVIDTVVAHMPAEHDSYKEQHVRRVLKPLAHMAERLDCAVVGIMHLNRRESHEVLTRISGSGGFGNLARSVLIVSRDPKLPADDPARFLAHGKSNLGALAATVSWRIESDEVPFEGGTISTARVVWNGEVGTTARELLADGGAGSPTKLHQEIEDFLREQVLGRGPVDASAVLAEARERGLVDKTVRRAFAAMGGVSAPLAGSGSDKRFWTLYGRAPVDGDQ
jgi:hypothetical protein